MNSTDKIFKARLINKRLEHFGKGNIPNYEEKYKEALYWHNECVSKVLDNMKETSIQGTFMSALFNRVLGYTEVVGSGDCYNQEREKKTILDPTEADAALGFFYKSSGIKDVRVVVELKDSKTPLDKKQNRSSHLTPVEQAFTYANKNGSKCGWVIVSNFTEIRLYKSTSSLEYEVFYLSKLNDEKEFQRFYFFLCKDNLISENSKSLIDELYVENEQEGVDISNKFYRDYKRIRNDLFASLKKANPEVDELLLFTKSQKLMDRFTFICFCEDCSLLPPKVFSNLINNAKNSYSFSKTRLWDELKGLFESIDQGNPPRNINQYNGGLFKKDEQLDNLIVPDEALESFIALSEYDFNSDLNVNILGQIFEQSISDVEQIKQELGGIEVGGKGKQKDDGIFYTPYYVTRYIVEQTVGVYLNKKKEDLKTSMFNDSPIQVEAIRPSTGRKNTKEYTHWIEIPDEKEDLSEDERMEIAFAKELHRIYWLKYEEILKNIKICDPACGSGAFLNQCFDFLREEMDFVLDMRLQFDGQKSIFDIDTSILQNNLYGVDINAESVEITKLSLWLKTAKCNQSLASLDDNIKCGNSIICDKDIVENAFEWNREFATIFNGSGFDIVVGNPPYGAKLDEKQKKYIKRKYSTTEYDYNTYKTFLELGSKILKPGGYLGYITSNTLFTLEKGANKLRKFLFDEHVLCNVVEVFDVFPTAIVDPIITVFRKDIPTNEEFISICVPRKTVLNSTFLNEGVETIFTQNDLKRDPNYIFNYRFKDNNPTIIRMRNEKPLASMFNVLTGAKPYQTGKGNPPQTKELVEKKPYSGYVKIDDSWKPYLRGEYINRYTNKWAGNKEYIKYGEWLAEPRDKSVFMGEKIFLRQTGDSLIATYDKGNVSNNTLHSIYPKDNNCDISLFYLLGILNSSLMNWYYKKTFYQEDGKPYAEVKGSFVKKLPIAIGSDEQIGKVEKHVKELLDLCQKKFDRKLSFLQFVKDAYHPKKKSEQLENFNLLSFDVFVEELKNVGVKLTVTEKREFYELFNNEMTYLSDITSKIYKEQTQLDSVIFSIYGVLESEKNNILSELTVVL